jgi:hypothetical protein
VDLAQDQNFPERRGQLGHRVLTFAASTLAINAASGVGGGSFPAPSSTSSRAC